KRSPSANLPPPLSSPKKEGILSLDIRWDILDREGRPYADHDTAGIDRDVAGRAFRYINGDTRGKYFVEFMLKMVDNQYFQYNLRPSSHAQLQVVTETIKEIIPLRVI
ncbi:hypothetical protein ACJMK2_002031, partial [Sinanodonta woodiana]